LSHSKNVFSKCLRCGGRWSGIHLKCPKCGGVTVLEYDSISLNIEKSEASIWRYRGLLPEFQKRISLGEGLTPLRVIDGVRVKNERKNPTGSYSDRASSLLASYLASTGRRGPLLIEYVEDYAYSITYYTRGVTSVRIVVRSPLEADMDELVKAYRLGAGIELDATVEPDVPYINPLTIEGLKTILLEIHERKLDVEDVVVPVKTGALAFSICKAINELVDLGLDPGYTVVGALMRGQGKPWLLNHCGKWVRLEEIEPEEAAKSLLKLSSMGVKTKLISASAYSMAKILGNSIAVITVGEKQVKQRREISKLGSEIIKVLEKQGDLTAYEIWRILDKYTLRGVYKALKTLEDLGLLCTKHVLRGTGKKVKTYTLCGDIYLIE